MHRERVSDLRRLAVVMAILSAPAIGAALGACGTVLELAPDSSNGEGGEGGNGGGDGPSTLDGSEIFLDGAAACPISVDRTAVAMGEVLLDRVHTETVGLKTNSADAWTVRFTVAGDGFTASSSPVTVDPVSGGSIDVTFAAGADAAVPTATGTLVIEAKDCSPITVGLEATRSNATFGVAPGTLNLVARCGTVPPSGTIQIQSTSSSATTWSVTPQMLPAPFTLSAASGTVMASGATSIPVGATALSQVPSLSTATINVLVDAEAPKMHTIQLAALAQGPTLSYVPTIVTFASGSSQSAVSVTNTGNETVTVVFNTAPIVVNGGKSFTLAKGETKSVIVLIGSTATVPVKTVIFPSTTPALCQDGGLGIDKPK